MITIRTNETQQDGLYREWLNNLVMYQQELLHLQQIIKTRGYRKGEPDTSIELEALHELVQTQKAKIESLSDEVVKKRNHHKTGLEEGVIAFADVLRNNQLREKIRKAEHSVFYLKHHIHKLLSIAS